MRKIYAFILTLMLCLPIPILALQDTPGSSYQAQDENITVTVNDPNNNLPDNASVKITKGSTAVESTMQRKAKKELDNLDSGGDGSFVSQRYENASVKDSTAYIYDVKITYNENGEEKEYIPSKDDGISIVFSVNNENYEKDTKELDVFNVSKNAPELIEDKTDTEEGSEVKAQKEGKYLVLSVDYIAKAGSPELLSAEEKATELLAHVDPDKFLTDPNASTYDDAKLSEMRAGAQEAISGISNSRDKIEAITKLVATRTYYDYPYVNNNEPLTALNPYDVWTKKITVCDGYSRLLQTLCISVDIPCFRIYSDDHAYNACYDRDNGRWIIIDSTWASGNKYTVNKEMSTGSYRPSYFDMSPSFLAQLSNHEIFSLSGILDGNTYYTYYPSYTATSWSNMKWDTWPDQTDWHLKISGLKNGTELNSANEYFCDLPITEVESGAFSNKKLTSVILPASIKEIENYAFRYNYDLKTVSIPGNDDLNILYSAFYGDNALETIDIDKRKLNIVGDAAFENATALRTFGDDLLEVGNVGSEAFRGCSSLEDPVKISGDIEYSAFYNCEKIPSINAKTSNATEIGTYVFRGCASAEEISLPINISVIPDYTFYGCTNLKKADVNIANVSAIKKSAFYNCKNLTMPTDWSKSSIKDISESVFRNNESLKELKLPNTLQSIGYASFAGCSSIEEMDLSNTNLKTIDNYGLYGMNSLSMLKLPATLESSQSTSFSTTNSSVIETFVIGNVDKGALYYQKDNSGAWKGRKVHFGTAIFNAIFNNGETPIKLHGTVEEGIKIPACTAEKPFYSFDGWKDNKGDILQAGDTVNGSPSETLEYNINWKPVEYEITYDLGGGTNGDNPATYNIESGDIVLKDATKDGSTFLGWYSDPERQSEIDSINSKDPKNITIYAKWECAHAQTKIANKKEATCIEEGYTGDVVCSACNETIQKGTVIDKVSHHWDVEKEETMATCRENGNVAYKHCVTCNKYFNNKEEEIAKEDTILHKEDVQHTIVHQVMSDSTCKEEGTEECWKCSICGKYFADADAKNEITTPVLIPKKDHSWDSGKITKEATCSEAGIKTYTCENCNSQETEEIPKIHHDLIKHSRVDATCDATGTEEYWECNACNKLFSDKSGTKVISTPKVIPKKQHSWKESYIKKAPTCTSTGITVQKCELCNEERSITTAIISHTLKEYPRVEPTYAKEGTERYWKCTTCAKMFADSAGKNTISLPKIIAKLTPTKKAQTIKVKNKTIKLSVSKLKKKAQTVSASKITKSNKANTKITYALVKVNNKKYKKYFKVSKTGKMVVKKGIKKGKYKVSIKATAAGNQSYKAATKAFNVVVVVK